MLKTSVASPWALILSGGAVAGQRPRTTLAWIVQAFEEGGRVVAYQIVPHEGNGQPAQRSRRIAADGVIKTWRNRPKSVTLRRSREKLRRVAPELPGQGSVEQQGALGL